MSQRALRFPFAPLTVIALVGALFGASAPAGADDNPCTASRFEFKEVEKACKEGGRVAAKKMMNAVVKKAKEAGEQMNCKTCHNDVKDKFDLKPNANADFKRWL